MFTVKDLIDEIKRQKIPLDYAVKFTEGNVSAQVRCVAMDEAEGGWLVLKAEE